MAKDVRRETTVTYKCDGCGQEDVKIDEYVQEHLLPLGWGSLLFVDGIEPNLGQEGSNMSMADGDRLTTFTARSGKPFRLILCCHLCSKKLADFFKSKESVQAPTVPIKKPWWARWI